MVGRRVTLYFACVMKGPSMMSLSLWVGKMMHMAI